MRNACWCCAVGVLLGAGLIWADRGGNGKDAEDRGNAPADRVFEVELLRMAELGSVPPLGTMFNQNGNDPLMDGSVAVNRQREVEVQVQGASASGTYLTLFCPFGFPPNYCSTIGSFTTNAGGNWSGRFPVPASQQTWTGVFLLTRNTLNEFVSGFRTPPAAQQQTDVEVELRGRIGTVNTLSRSFQLQRFPLNILVGTSTRFQGITGLGALRTGDEVVVTGFVQTDGSIFATRVRSADNGQDGDH